MFNSKQMRGKFTLKTAAPVVSKDGLLRLPTEGELVIRLEVTKDCRKEAKADLIIAVFAVLLVTDFVFRLAPEVWYLSPASGLLVVYKLFRYAAAVRKHRAALRRYELFTENKEP